MPTYSNAKVISPHGAQFRFAALIAIAWLALSTTTLGDEVDVTATPLVNPAAITDSAEELPQPLPTTDVGLRLEDLEAMALAGNPALGRAAAIIGAARGNWVQVGLKPNPNVGYEGQQLGSNGLAEQYGVAFGQEIITGGKLRLNRAIARGDIEVAEQELAALRLRVLTDVRIAYYQVLVAQRQIALADELIFVSQEGTKSVDALLTAKQVGRVDVIQAKLESEQAQLAKLTALNRLDAAWRELGAVVGSGVLAPQPIVGDPAAEPCDHQYDELLSRLLSQSPEIASAAAELGRARAALGRARVERLPNVNVQGLVNWQDNGIGGGADGTVAVSVPLPIFDRNQGGIMRAEREVIAAQQAIAQLELDLQQRLAPVFERYVNARQEVSRYQEAILPAAQESLLLTRELYEAGETNYSGLLISQRTFANSNREYLDSVLRLRVADAELDGLLLTGSLAARGDVELSPAR